MNRRVVWAVLGCLSGSAVGADWLVLESGPWIETKGSWQVKGRLVTFTTVDGKYQALPLSEVDLEASREATTPPIVPYPAEERLLEGESVEIPHVEPVPISPPKLAFGDSLEHFILDPEAPRVRSTDTIAADRSRSQDAYLLTDLLKKTRERAACKIGEEAVREIETAFDQGEFVEIVACYDPQRYFSATSVDWCLARVLESALRDAIGKEPGACRRESPKFPELEID